MIYSIFFLVLSSLLGVYMYVRIALEPVNSHEIHSSRSLAGIAGHFTSFIISFNLFSIFSVEFSLICIINCIVSAVITSQFYSTQQYNSAILGIFTGSVAGVFGTVLGYVALNPEICGLPGISSDLQNISITIGVFLLILHSSIVMKVNLYSN